MNWVIIASGNALSPVRRQAIAWTNAGLLSIVLLGTSFGEIWIEIVPFSFKIIHLKMSSVKWRPFFPEKDELKYYSRSSMQHTHSDKLTIQVITQGEPVTEAA